MKTFPRKPEIEMTVCKVLLYCIRVPAANVPGCSEAEGLFYKPWSFVVPTCTPKCLH